MSGGQIRWAGERQMSRIRAHHERFADRVASSLRRQGWEVTRDVWLGPYRSDIVAVKDGERLIVNTTDRLHLGPFAMLEARLTAAKEVDGHDYRAVLVTEEGADKSHDIFRELSRDLGIQVLFAPTPAQRVAAVVDKLRGRPVTEFSLG
jgi:hypothetical protein